MHDARVRLVAAAIVGTNCEVCAGMIAARAAIMNVSDFLSTERVISTTNGTRNRDQLLQVLSDRIAATVPSIDGRALLSALRDRENLGSTALEGGVALPHARMNGLPHTVVAFARSPDGIDWGAPDGGLSHLVLLLVTPSGHNSSHLQLIAAASRLLRDPGCRAELMNARDSAEILGIISAREHRHAGG